MRTTVKREYQNCLPEDGLGVFWAEAQEEVILHCSPMTYISHR